MTARTLFFSLPWFCFCLNILFYFIGYFAWLEGSQFLGHGFQVMKPGILTIRPPDSSLPQGFMWWLRLLGQPRPAFPSHPAGLSQGALFGILGP